VVTRRRDFRIICDCQRHARTRASWGKALRVASRGAALLVSIPLAFAALDLPTSAMNININEIRAMRGAQPLPAKAVTSGMASSIVPSVAVAPAATDARRLPVFTTPAVREAFLDPAKRPLTLDIFKKNYFERHIPYGEIIFREARRHRLRPELVAAIVHTESDFRPRLVSSKSAQGLMQIVPSTARLLGVRDPFDPEQNIAAGTKYFRYLLDRFDNETMALAAYNAGEGNVARFGGIPPFTETQNYISRVNRRTDRYRLRVHATYTAALRANVENPQ
jgi:soluble lytic murein transglycosylase-like protein